MEVEVVPALELGQAPVLERHVIGVVEVVHAGHDVTVIQQELGDLLADETGRAGDKITSHGSTSARGANSPRLPSRAL